MTTAFGGSCSSLRTVLSLSLHQTHKLQWFRATTLCGCRPTAPQRSPPHTPASLQNQQLPCRHFRLSFPPTHPQLRWTIRRKPSPVQRSPFPFWPTTLPRVVLSTPPPSPSPVRRRMALPAWTPT